MSNQQKESKQGFFAKLFSAFDSGTDAAQGVIEVRDGVASITGAQLKTISLFKDCPDAFLDTFAASFKSESFPAGQRVIRKGDPAEKFYILAKGGAVVSDIRRDQDKLYLAQLGAGDFMGEIALLRGVNRTADVETVTPCVFLTVTRQEFLAAVDNTPQLRAAVEKIIDARVREDERAELLRSLSSI